jgi:hypothetical protein
MIGKISGRLDWRGPDHVLIDVRGVGYIVHVSDRTLAGMPGLGEAVSLYTDLLVREDLLQLFGFPTMLEKEWHKLLMTVQGVGRRLRWRSLGRWGPRAWGGRLLWAMRGRAGGAGRGAEAGAAGHPGAEGQGSGRDGGRGWPQREGRGGGCGDRGVLACSAQGRARMRARQSGRGRGGCAVGAGEPGLRAG